MTIVPGVRLGPYEIVASLGAGGMGEVYRARDTRLGRSVALKILSPDRGVARAPARSAKRTVTAGAPARLPAHDVGTEGGRRFVMELLEGETLATRLIKGRCRSIDVALCDKWRRLDAAHRAGIDR